jgi:DNA polymerase elongation subunit (family B)
VQPIDRGRANQDEWLWGWDPTPGIVSVWADGDGRATVWRRIPSIGLAVGTLVRETVKFRPWMLLDRLDDLQHLGAQFAQAGTPGARITWRELEGPGALRFLIRADGWQTLKSAVLRGASRRFGRPVQSLRELGKDSLLALPPEEQYLVASGRTYFRDLTFDDLRRMQIDLETTGLDARRSRIFMIAVRHPDGRGEILEARDDSDAAEAELIARLVATVRDADPDVIENHNLHGFDLPFLEQRARRLGVPLSLGRFGQGLRQRAARRGVREEAREHHAARVHPSAPDRSARASSTDDDRDDHDNHDGYDSHASGASGGSHVEADRDEARRRIRFVAPGRELIDTMDFVIRHGFATGELSSHGLKAVARHFGAAGPDREMIRGDQVYETYRRDPARVRRYATADVDEVAGLARMLGGAAFALARMAPRRYERLADAGAATGVIDPLLVRAYLRAGCALPAHQRSDGTPHSGAALHLFGAGVVQRVVKADVASLYPSLMRAYRIGPVRDRLGALLALVDRLVERRLAAKAAARAAPPGSAERYTHEATSAAMKLVVNSAYGYLAAGGELTRFADVHAANEVTRRGRAVLDLMCRSLAARGVTLVEADTDGVYFAVPDTWTTDDERRVVSEVGALLPPLVQLELDGRYAAMLSHEPKNYALLTYDRKLLLKGVAFRSSRAEPFGEAFLRRALACLLVGDVVGVREAYDATVLALRRRELSAYDVSSRVRLTKTPEEYAEVRETRRELTYEAMLSSGKTTWNIGDRVRVYRTPIGYGRIVDQGDDDAVEGGAPPGQKGEAARRDYDVDHYLRQLRDTFASRMVRAFAPDDFAAVFGDPDQLLLFPPAIDAIRPLFTSMDGATSMDEVASTDSVTSMAEVTSTDEGCT